MSLTAALADCYRRLNFQTSPASAVTTRLTAFLNEAQQDIIGEIGGSRLLHGTITFASVASQAEYGLPPTVARPLSVRDTANNRRLEQISESVYRAMLPNPASSSGTSDRYALLGIGPMAIRPTAAAAIFIISDNAGDVQVAQFDMITSAGQRVTGSATVNGITGVQFGTLGTIVEIVDVYLATVAVGTITIRMTSGVGTVLGSIYTGQLRPQYQRIALVTTPAAALTYAVDYEMDATDLVNATDEFPLPPRFRQAVTLGALRKEYAHAGDVLRYELTTREYDRDVKMLRHYLASGPDTLTIPGGGFSSPSNLPGNWPWSGWSR